MTGFALPISRRAALPLTAAIALPMLARAQAPPQPPGSKADEQPFITLEAAPADIQIRAEPRPKTAVMAFGGTIPGPVLRVKQGDELRVRFTNRLAQPASLHWRGMRVPAALDGVAGVSAPAIAPGATQDIRILAKEAGTYLYHPLVAGQTSALMDSGLYGALIVEEREPPQADREMLVILDDWRLNAESQIQVPEASIQGSLPVPGNVLTVNGAPRAASDNVRPRSRVRLRLINATTARIMLLKFEGAAATVVAVDGQPSSTAFQPKNAVITLTPGGRMDVLADIPADAGQHFKILTPLSADVTVPVLDLTAAGEPMHAAPLSAVKALPGNGLPERLDLARASRAECVIDGGPAANGAAKPWTLNGTALTDLGKAKPLFKAKAGTTVVLSFKNQTAIPQPMTVHGHHGRLLFVFDDGWDPFWTDTVLVQPGKTARFAFIADNPGQWLVRSAYASLFDAGVAGWFEVG
ncbi:MAG: multicopper oxidase family protein [Beijerinckiaceae bacterium]